MKTFCLALLIGMGIFPAQGQHTYTSPLTQHWPTIFTTEFEEVNRSLMLEPGAFTLVTEMTDGKIFERYLVEEVQDTEKDIRFLCTNKARTSLITLIIPHQKKVEIIDIYRPSPATGETEQIRLWID